MIWTVPNILTFLRILAAPCVALVFYVFDRPLADWIAFGLFVGAAFTDFFDGWLARKLNQMSEIGKMLDPIADKAMVIIALAVLMNNAPPMLKANLGAPSYDNWIAICAVTIIMREILVSGLREYLGNIKLDVTALAKWKTTAQMVAIGLLLLSIALFAFFDARLSAVDGYSGSVTFDDFEALMALDLAKWTHLVGASTLCIAAILTVITGWDYFRKGLAYIQEKEGR